MDLTMAVGTYGYTEAVTRRSELQAGVGLRQVVVEPIIGAYRRMIRDLEFDICEVAPTTYMIARSQGVPITALPIFLSRGFHYGDLVCRSDSGIIEPKDLEGRRVGVRAYTVTTGVWVRGMLAERYGVDLDRVEWIVDDEDHIRALPLPANVTELPPGSSIAEEFERGSIDAALKGPAGVGRKGSPLRPWRETAVAADASFRYRELFDDPDDRARADFAASGVYPIHRALVFRDDLRERVPGIVETLFELFAEASAGYSSQLSKSAADTPIDREQRRLAAIVGGDPLPQGFECNRPTIEALIRYATDQKVLPAGVRAEEMFVPIDR